MALLIPILLLVSIFSHVSTKTPGQILDESLNKLSKEIKVFKLLQGKCAPCLITIGMKDCDCTNLAPKRDCLEFLQSGVSVNGVYKVSRSKFNFHYVYCDQTTQGGGWTVIQRRKDGSESFYRNWNDYKSGFGKLGGEFWFGNDNIHDLTSGLTKSSSLLVDLKFKNKQKKWAKYNKFEVGDAKSKYLLKVSGYSGNAGDSLKLHNNRKFSTHDQDNDIWSGNCAVSYKGAWWYKKCFGSHLNGLYQSAGTCQRMVWGSCSVKIIFSEMKVKRNI